MILSVQRNGTLVISRKRIFDNIPIVEGKKSALEKCLVMARLAYDGKTFLVPGVPEADSEKEALEAVGIRVGRTPGQTAEIMREVLASQSL